MLVSCKLFGRIKLTLEQLLTESARIVELVKTNGESKSSKEKRNQSAALVMELQYAMQDFLVGVNTFRTRSFRQLYLVPEFFNCLDLLFKFLDAEFEYVEGYYANVIDRALDLQNIIVILKTISKEDYSLVLGLRRRINSLYQKFSQSTEGGLSKSECMTNLLSFFQIIFLTQFSNQKDLEAA